MIPHPAFVRGKPSGEVFCPPTQTMDLVRTMHTTTMCAQSHTVLLKPYQDG